MRNLHEEREYLGHYTLRICGFRPGGQQREIVAFAKGGTFEMRSGTCANFSEYEVVHEDFRNHGIQDVIRVITNALSAEYGKQRELPFIGRLGEIEYKDQGTTEMERNASIRRIKTWSHKGALCVLPVSRKTGKVELLHLQPTLRGSEQGSPVPLNWFFRPFRKNALQSLDIRSVRACYDAYMSRPGRGMLPENLKRSRDFFERQIEQCDISLQPIEEIPSFISFSPYDELVAKMVKASFNLSVGNPSTQRGRNLIYKLAKHMREMEQGLA